MTLGNLALGVFLILLALKYLGVDLPALVLGISALLAGILVIFAGSVVVVGPRS